jgi:hypothetical protein
MVLAQKQIHKANEIEDKEISPSRCNHLVFDLGTKTYTGK